MFSFEFPEDLEVVMARQRLSQKYGSEMSRRELDM